ncbi:DUF3572 domain-containing protein [Pseudoxanthobacter sp. M-2]|uniref:DUF3572 domain-containing protein n=1 Tax=Pseudoxanthobacter sp. M-2 TaxID=3078754 RepID=UPI0038FC8274
MRPGKAPPMNREAAESLGVDALVFLADDEDRLDRFLALTGLAPGDLRGLSTSPGFLAGVLDHLMSDERLLVAFAEEHRLDPTTIARASALLNGGYEG